MLFEQAYNTLAKRLGQREDLIEDIKFEMQEAQNTILEQDHMKPWFLVSEETEAWTDLGDDRVHIPAGFLAEYELGALFLIRDNGSIKPLIKEELDCLVNKFGDAQGEPSFYTRTGYYFRLYRIPDKQYKLRMVCYMKADALTEGQENVWLKHASDWLIAETGYVLADQYLQNPRLADRFQQQAVKARQRIWRENEAQQLVNRDLIKGI